MLGVVGLVVTLVLVACDATEPSSTRPRSTTSTTEAETATTAREPATYHVSTSGDDDGGGSEAQPWRTLQHALEALHPGDTLVVAGGTYRERLRDIHVRRGRDDAPITVEAAPGERPVVEGLLWLEDADHWTVRGINVTWSSRNKKSEHMVKLTGGEAWAFVDAEVWGARSYAAILVAGKPKDFRLSGLYVHDTHKANGRNEDHLLYLNCGRGGGVVERSVLANSPNGRAVKVGPGDKDGDEVGNITIRYNTMYRNLGPSNIQLAWSVSDVDISRNVMVDPAEDRANVTAFDLDGSGNRVHDNVGWGGARIVDDDRGLVDGGNVRLDPQLRDPASGDFHPMNARAAAYGRYGD